MDKLKFAAVIPSRGDRPAFDNWQRIRAERLGYDEIIMVDYPPVSNAFDLYQRLSVGFAKAEALKCDFVSVCENDDYYALDYLEQVKDMASRVVDIIGFDRTTYYHLPTAGYKFMVHPGRSSMFTTTISTKKFGRLINAGSPYLDITWWNQAMGSFVWRLSQSEPFLGIKHGIGKVGGNGHRVSMYNVFDLDRQWLRDKVDAQAFEFYKQFYETKK